MKEAEEDAKPSKLDDCKYYTSLLLGFLAIVSVFIFLFLVPFILDPAISTLAHDFVDNPVTCMVTNVSVIEGKSKCKWSSCREGCTADMYHCYQVRVKYAPEVPYDNETHPTSFTIDQHQWINLKRFDVAENRVSLRVLIDSCLGRLRSSEQTSPNHF